MNKLLLNTLLFSCLFLMFSPSIIAQEKSSKKEDNSIPTIAKTPNNEAIKLYDNMAYKASIDAFMKQDNLSVSDKLKIADSYRMIHDTKKAELWYQQVIDKDIDEIHLLHYAQALQSNGKTQLAAQYFSEFSNMVKEDDSWNGISSSLAKSIEKDVIHTHTGINIVNEQNINSNGIDYSPLYFENGIVFVSSNNPEIDEKTTVDPWMKENFMSLLFSEKSEDGHYKKPRSFSKKLTSIYHEGPSSYSPIDKVLYFSRNHSQGQKKIVNTEGVTRMQIYQATKKGNDWVNIKELSFNLPKYDNCHPSISPDGTTMYFASNRVGGYGGMDLYVTTFDGFKWSNPTNLGPTINTAGHEVFPFIHDNGTLFFSSNGYEGVGGLDIFFTKDTEGLFSIPMNVGKPFNSSKDDFGFVLDNDKKSGMFSSARSGGSGKDDIYSFEVTDNLKYCVYDAYSNKILANTELLIYENIDELSLNNEGEDAYFKLIPRTSEANMYDLVYKSNKTSRGRKIITDNNGYFTMVASPDKDYHIRTVNGQTELKGILNAGYASNFFDINNDAACIPMNIKKTKTTSTTENSGLKVIVKNKKYNKLIPNATIRMVNLCTGEEYDYQTDQDGNVHINGIECGCEFTFTSQKKNFKNGFATFSTLNDDCKDKKKMELEVGMYPESTIPTTTSATILPTTPTTDKTTLPTPTVPSPRTTAPTSSNYFNDISAVKNEDMKEGNIIILDVYYDFDEFFIRSDANIELDKVVNLMRKYPTISVELSSHTDSRGARDYNTTLSRQRAQQAVNNILRKGISRNRIFAKGYGEDRPKIDCGKNCTESQHQENRRTEIKILSVN